MAALSEFPEGPLFEVFRPLRGLLPGRTEVERMNHTPQFLQWANPHASGGSFTQAYGVARVGAAAGSFSGSEGFYDLTIGYFDESDGVSWMELLVNGEVLARFDWDAPGKDPIVTSTSLEEFTQGAVYLEAGDEIMIRGAADGDENLRTDYLEITASSELPYGTTVRIEAEDATGRNGFYVEKNGAASEGVNLRSFRPNGAEASYSLGFNGHFDIEIGYFDETDGVSQLTVYKNEEVLGVIDWDSLDGDAIASKASARTLLLEDVELEARDVLKLSGTSDCGEPLRLDYIDLTSVEPPSSPTTERLPDLWYVLDGEVKLSLNRGTGVFDWKSGAVDDKGIPTGIMIGNGEVTAADYDGDGDTDFLRVEVSEPYPLATAALDEDQPGTLSITARFYENDGRANFAVSGAFSGTFDVTWDAYGISDANAYALLHGLEEEYVPTGYFDFADAADMDGDGDLDFFGFSMAAAAPLVFENQRDNTFELLEHQFPFQWDNSYGSLSYYENSGFFADMNGDAHLDIVYVADYLLSSTFVLINDGTGKFNSTATIYGGDDGTYSEVVGDLDGDGDNDIALVGISDGGEIFAFINDGTGASAGYPSYPPSYETLKGSVEVGDFDGDGIDEILNSGFQDISNGYPPGLRTFQYDSERKLLVEESYAPDFSGNVIAVDDFDGDGDLDFLATIYPVFDYDAHQYSHPAPRLFLNDGTGAFDLASDEYVTPEWGEVQFSRVRPEVGIGYFDDPYLMA